MHVCSNPELDKECTSCQVCAAICPKNAIAISINKEGFYRPIVDESKCIDCSVCIKVCYKYDSSIILSDTAEKHYAAYSKESNILNSTTSGGIAHLLSSSLIEQGYKCVGVIYDNDQDCAIDIVANNKEMVNLFKGSKYIQSYTYDAFKEILNTSLNEKIAVFGTPCHIYAIDKFLRLKKKRDNFVLIDIYCHGCPSLNVWKRYVKEVKDLIRKPKFDSVEFRSKIKGWGRFYVVVVVEGVRAFISSFRKDEFYDLFFSNYMLNDACYKCKLRSSLHYTDIRLGDFWGKCYVKNNKGVSVVSVVSKRGSECLNSIKEQIKIKEHKFEDFISYQSYGTEYEYNLASREKMFEILQDDSNKLKDVVRYYYSQQSYIQKLKRYIKSVVTLFPPQMIRYIKFCYYKLQK